MNKILALVIVTLLLAYACKSGKDASNHQHQAAVADQPVDTLKKSIPKEVHTMIGQAHITLKYYAPAVRGRQIWGGLVPYGEVWVTGAHRATSFEISEDFTIAGNRIAAGKYALFTIPGQETWVFIINKKWDQHLSDEYNIADDVARIEVKPEVTNEIQERLKYTIQVSSNSAATLNIRWEKINLSIPFEIQKK